MKDTTSRWDYLDEMKSEVVRQFKEQVRLCRGPFVVGDIYRRVIHSPQRRYYVGSVAAYKALSRAKRGDWSRIERMPPHRREMYRQLYEICCRLERSPLHRNDNYLTIVSLAISHPAPRLFVGYHTVQNIVNEYYKIRICNRKK
jgi:hypothetical protein